MLNRRDSLGAFLRYCRERTKPSKVNLETNGYRRTPGLTRKEVAHFVGISEGLYKQLEQGRKVTTSTQVLERLAEVFCLSLQEQSYLFGLAGKLPRLENTPTVERIPKALQQLLYHQCPSPALIMDQDWNFIGWNRPMSVAFVDAATLPPYERNLIYQLFMNERTKEFLVNWEFHAKFLIRHIRLQREQYGMSSELQERIEMALQTSNEFAQWWESPMIEAKHNVVKELRHPQVGYLGFNQTMCLIADSPCLRIAFYMIRDEQTLQNMERLLYEG